MAKPYETVVVVDAMIPDESITSEFDAVKSLIEKEGKLVKLDRWGKRKLAYTIRKRTHGEYAVFYYEAESGAIAAELEKRFRINENILRWLSIADNPVGVPRDKTPEELAAEAAPREGREGREERGGRDRDRDRDDRHEGRRDRNRED
ncbi:MAG TPA: 30S ribosomal protein S6 [Fibrobacteria bacterium]|nr:30S ribosomal protein S6 [Fibrobacteria bacterium]